MPKTAAAAGVVEWVLAEHRALRAAYDFDVRMLVPRDLLTQRPAGAANSIVWLVWHLARCEDAVVNALVRGAPQVLERDGWPGRIATTDTRIGTGFTAEEVDALSCAVDPGQVDAYWTAVRQATAAWLQRVPASELDRVPPNRLDPASLVPSDGAWILDRWRDKPASFLLSDAVIAHGYAHLGEMQTVRGLLGIRGL